MEIEYASTNSETPCALVASFWTKFKCLSCREISDLQEVCERHHEQILNRPQAEEHHPSLCGVAVIPRHGSEEGRSGQASSVSSEA
jgi:hypothetical protein